MNEELKDKSLLELEEEERAKEIQTKPLAKLIAIGGGGRGGDWLTNLNIGCCFLAKQTGNKSGMLHEFWILHMYGRARKLLSVQADKEIPMWVDPLLFCKEFDLFEVVDP